jgi:hypothetical protein
LGGKRLITRKPSIMWIYARKSGLSAQLQAQKNSGTLSSYEIPSRFAVARILD